MPMTAAQKKRAQRNRDRALGWTDMTIRVPIERVEDVRAYVATLPPPAPPIDPRQLNLIDRIDAEIAGDMSPDDAPGFTF